MEQISFKQRVKDAAINYAPKYRDIFCNYEYLIISEALPDKYCIIKAEQGNFLHLIGVNTALSPLEFFNRCIDGTLAESDFDFHKKTVSEKSLKGSIREKITVLPAFIKMFSAKELNCQSNFTHGKICCHFATSDKTFTVGFVSTGRPKSLMKKDQLNSNLSKPVIAILRRSKGDKTFQEVISGDTTGYDSLLSGINNSGEDSQNE